MRIYPCSSPAVVISVVARVTIATIRLQWLQIAGPFVRRSAACMRASPFQAVQIVRIFSVGVVKVIFRGTEAGQRSRK